MNTLAVIGSASLARLPQWHTGARRIVRTPYGQPSAPLLEGEVGGRPVVFLCRHGLNNTIAPQLINYRANIWALHSIGAENIIAVSAVTSINRELENGSLVMPHDLIDYTHGRKSTFFEGQEQAVVHTDFACPYSAELRTTLLEHVGSHGTYVYSEAVYGCTQGPRLATHAEVRRYRNDGVDVLGMTGMPEAVLARELNIGYAHFCGIIGMSCITNNGNGRPDFCQTESHQAIEKIRRLLIDL